MLRPQSPVDKLLTLDELYGATGGVSSIDTPNAREYIRGGYPLAFGRQPLVFSSSYDLSGLHHL